MEFFSRFNPEGVEQWRLTQNPAVGIGSESHPDADTIPDGV
jgi:hypothetical protein